jgi:zinc transport system permease protein
MENLRIGKDYKMDELISLMKYTFMQRAIICGIAISFCAALIGVILVLKNYSMIGHGLGEVGFAALSLAMALNLPELTVAVPLVIVAAIIIMIISQKKGESGDVTIALVASRSINIWCNNYCSYFWFWSKFL